MHIDNNLVLLLIPAALLVLILLVHRFTKPR